MWCMKHINPKAMESCGVCAGWSFSRPNSNREWPALSLELLRPIPAFLAPPCSCDSSWMLCPRDQQHPEILLLA